MLFYALEFAIRDVVIQKLKQMFLLSKKQRIVPNVKNVVLVNILTVFKKKLLTIKTNISCLAL